MRRLAEPPAGTVRIEGKSLTRTLSAERGDLGRRELPLAALNRRAGGRRDGAGRRTGSRPTPRRRGGDGDSVSLAMVPGNGYTPATSPTWRPVRSAMTGGSGA